MAHTPLSQYLFISIHFKDTYRVLPFRGISQKPFHLTVFSISQWLHCGFDRSDIY